MINKIYTAVEVLVSSYGFVNMGQAFHISQTYQLWHWYEQDFWQVVIQTDFESIMRQK